MAEDPGFRKYRDAILGNLLQHQDSFLDLDVICSDGALRVHGTVFASLITALRGLGSICVEDFCVILPDITTSELSTFLQCLYNTKLEELNQSAMRILRDISSLLGYTDFDGIEPPEDQIVVQEVKEPVEEVKEKAGMWTFLLRTFQAKCGIRSTLYASIVFVYLCQNSKCFDF